MFFWERNDASQRVGFHWCWRRWTGCRTLVMAVRLLAAVDLRGDLYLAGICEPEGTKTACRAEHLT